MGRDIIKFLDFLSLCGVGDLKISKWYWFLEVFNV